MSDSDNEWFKKHFPDLAEQEDLDELRLFTDPLRERGVQEWLSQTHTGQSRLALKTRCAVAKKSPMRTFHYKTRLTR